jgi:hypothetical protein
MFPGFADGTAGDDITNPDAEAMDMPHRGRSRMHRIGDSLHA